jgi:Zincin-like metallopeptidase
MKAGFKARLAACTSAAALATGLLAGAPSASGAPVSTEVSLTLVDSAARAAGQRLSAPSTAPVKSKFKVRGKVKVKKKSKRTVLLLEKRGKRTRVIARDKTTKKGAFSFKVKAGKKQKARKFVVLAPKARGAKKFQKRFKVRIVSNKAATAVTPTWANGTSVAYSATPITASGLVGGAAAAGRTVLVQQQLGGTWTDAGQTVSGADGSYSVALANDWLRSVPTRVVVPRTSTAAAAVSEPAGTAVVPDYVPNGTDPNDWTEFDPARRYRFNPCAPIVYKVNYSFAPPYARTMMARVMRHVRLATGYTLIDGGDTAAWPDPAPGQPEADAETMLIIGFGGQANTTMDLSGNTLGRGGPDKGVWARDSLGRHVQITRGSLMLDTVEPPVPWTEDKISKTLTHEIAHALGLGHATSLGQMLGPINGPERPSLYGTGDLAGLATKGMQTGCSRPETSRGARVAPVVNDIKLS